MDLGWFLTRFGVDFEPKLGPKLALKSIWKGLKTIPKKYKKNDTKKVTRADAVNSGSGPLRINKTHLAELANARGAPGHSTTC